MLNHKDNIRGTWAIESIVAEVKKRDGNFASRRPSQRSWNRLFRTTLDRLQKVTRRLKAEDITAEEWRAASFTVLFDGHISAAKLGRQRAGDLLSMNLMDETYARRVMAEESAYLQAFAKKIIENDPRFWDGEGTLRHRQINAQLAQYAHKMRGTANMAFEGTSPDDSTFDWVMLNVEHCEVCPTRQAGSPYAKGTLPSRPGDGSTPCRSFCGCVLVRQDGIIGFARTADPPEFVAQAVDNFIGSGGKPQDYSLPDLFAAPDTIGEFFAI